MNINASKIVPALPFGYRWATVLEGQRVQHPAYFNRMVQVSAKCDGELVTSYAITDNPLVRTR